MTRKEKEEKLENFKEWITFIDDRVNAWKNQLPETVARYLNWSLDSLNTIENHILNTYDRRTVLHPENKTDVDAIASYIGETFRLHLPNAHWRLELDDKRNIDFNMPTVITSPQAGAPISPFPMVLLVLNNKTAGVLKEI